MSNSHISYYQPDLQVLYCSLEKVESWHHSNLSAPYWRVYHNRAGESQIVIREEEYEKRIELTRDRIVVIPPNTAFRSDHIDSFYHFYLHFIARPPFYGTSERGQAEPLRFSGICQKGE